MSISGRLEIILLIVFVFLIGMLVGATIERNISISPNCECEEDLSCYTQVDFPCGEDVRAFNADETEEYEVRCTKYNITRVKLPSDLDGNITIIMYYEWKGDLYRHKKTLTGEELLKYYSWWQG